MSSEIPPPPRRRPDVFTPIDRVFMLFLLAGIALILAFNVFHKTALTTECQNAITKANTVINSQVDLIQGLQSSYESAVYKDSKVTTIYQQTFLANEYEFTALQMIALQNAAMLDITTNCH